MDVEQMAHLTIAALSEGSYVIRVHEGSVDGVFRYRQISDLSADLRSGEIQREEMEGRLRIYTMAARNKLLHYANDMGFTHGTGTGTVPNQRGLGAGRLSIDPDSQSPLGLRI